MDKTKHDHYLRVADALAECQVVEFELRFYLTTAFELVRKFLAGRMAFTMSETDYRKASMGELARVFGKLSANTQLASDLNRFCAKRNRLAHGAIARCITPDGELDEGHVARSIAELRDTKAEAERLTAALHREGAKIGLLLWFDDETSKPID